MSLGVLVFVFLVGFLAFTILVRTVVVVPQQSAYIAERLGRYSSTLNAGLHFLTPFVERVAYRHSLKEDALDIPEQVCITKDNVQVGIDGVLYLQVLDAARASYGISNYHFAISQLAQTTLRSEIGKIDLDRTFEERATINANVVTELDKATEPWGVKVLRYEIKNINPPRDIIQAMEKQMRAEREKRALILTSEGERDAKINQAEGEKQRVIKESEAARQRQINEAAEADARRLGPLHPKNRVCTDRITVTESLVERRGCGVGVVIRPEHDEPHLSRLRSDRADLLGAQQGAERREGCCVDHLAARREASSDRDHVLLRDTEVEEAIGMPCGEVDRSIRLGEVGGDDHDARVVVGEIREFLAEDERRDGCR